MFPGGPNNPNGAEAGVAGANVVGMFAPADVEGEIFFWAHDDTAVPGRAYRYRAKYLIQNPLFGSNLAAEENRDIFYLESAWSQWTDLVAFPSLTQLYVVSGVRQGRSSVTLEVFTRQGGKVRSRSYEVSPGDLVGAVDGLINFGTDWTVVDVRKNAKGEYYVLLMNADGELERRTFNGDQADLEFQRLRDEALRVRTEQQAAVPR